MSKKKSSDKYNPITVFYWLFILAGLGLPLIIYIFTYSPVLTANLARVLSHAKYLFDSGSHISADGWIASRGFLPFSLTYFLTFFADSTAWRDMLYSASLCCYAVYCASFLIFSISLHARNIITYICCAVGAFVLGYYGLSALGDGNSFLSYASLLLFLAGIVINCIRLKASAKAKYICYAISAVVVVASAILSLAVVKKSQGSSGSGSSSTASIKELLSYPVFNRDKLTDEEAAASGIATYLENNSIALAYSASDLTNIISIATKDTVRVANINSLTELQPQGMTDCRLATYDELAQTTGKIYLITSSSGVSGFEDYLFYASSEYSDDYYTLYSYGYRELITDTAIHEDMLAIRDTGFDTVYFSMTDISTMDMSELNRTKNWTAYTPNHIFSDLSALPAYSEAIFSKNPQRVALGIDPYILYTSAGCSESEYKALLSQTLEPMISEHPDVIFHFIFQSYQINHFAQYSDDDFADLYKAYEYYVDAFNDYENVTYNYYGYHEYIYENPHIYEQGTDYLLTTDIATTLLVETLSDESHRMNGEWLLNFVADFIDIAKEYPYENPLTYDLSDTTVVILGDSIFGNYHDNSAIQNVVANYSQASVICRAIGGSYGTSCKEGYQLLDQLNVSEINSELAATPAGNRLVFILEFGLNDYFDSLPIIDQQSPKDTGTFCGAFRTAIAAIRENWPNSEIILMAPGYINYYSHGNEPMIEGGHNLAEYRNAVVALSIENNTQCINLAEIGITPETCGRYLYNDFVHYNGNGRYYIGKYLLEYLSSVPDNNIQ